MGRSSGEDPYVITGGRLRSERYRNSHKRKRCCLSGSCLCWRWLRLVRHIPRWSVATRSASVRHDGERKDAERSKKREPRPTVQKSIFQFMRDTFWLLLDLFQIHFHAIGYDVHMYSNLIWPSFSPAACEHRDIYCTRFAHLCGQRLGQSQSLFVATCQHPFHVTPTGQSRGLADATPADLRI